MYYIAMFGLLLLNLWAYVTLDGLWCNMFAAGWIAALVFTTFMDRRT